MISRLAILARKSLPRIISRNGHHAAEIEKIPPQFRNITYNDVPLPRGSWQARYDELQRKYNALLASSIVIFASTIYVYFQTHDFVNCPDEPAERWYPENRFAPGEDGSKVI